MDKRIHTKRSANLTYRHYLFHFKWPLLGLSFLLILLTINPMNFTSYFFSSNEYQENIEILFTDAIYPIDVLNQDNPNENILYYLKKKDELKSIEDVKSINKQQKVILPLIKNKSSSNSYLILEFTPVFFHPRFCSNTKEEIFGKKCPFTNWLV